MGQFNNVTVGKMFSFWLMRCFVVATYITYTRARTSV